MSFVIVQSYTYDMHGSDDDCMHGGWISYFTIPLNYDAINVYQHALAVYKFMVHDVVTIGV